VFHLVEWFSFQNVGLEFRSLDELTSGYAHYNRLSGD